MTRGRQKQGETIPAGWDRHADAQLELVEAGISHAFHHKWISEVSRALKRGLLPKSLYALPQQIAAGFGPDVLTLQDDSEPGATNSVGGTLTLTKAKPKAADSAK